MFHVDTGVQKPDHYVASARTVTSPSRQGADRSKTPRASLVVFDCLWKRLRGYDRRHEKLTVGKYVLNLRHRSGKLLDIITVDCQHCAIRCPKGDHGSPDGLSLALWVL